MRIFLFIFCLISTNLVAQNLLTPEILWSLGRVNGEALSKDGKKLYYTVTNYDVQKNKGNTQLYSLEISSGITEKISEADLVCRKCLF